MAYIFQSVFASEFKNFLPVRLDFITIPQN